MTFRAGLYEYILSGEEFEDNAARRACSKSQQKGYEISRLEGWAMVSYLQGAHARALGDRGQPPATGRISVWVADRRLAFWTAAGRALPATPLWHVTWECK